METTSVAQAKRTIERANGTFQGRLVKELRIDGISTIAEANRYLLNKFIPKFNKRFALNFNMFPCTFETPPSKEKLNYVLAVLSTRKIGYGNTIKFNKKYSQPFDLTDKLIRFKPHTECLVILAFDGFLMVSIDENASV